MQAMTMTNPQDAYRRQGVLTSSPGELIVMLYDGLKKNLVLGRRAIIKSNMPGAHKYLMKAQDIVTELVTSLDMNYPISEELLNIYEFIIMTLEDANVHKNAELIDPIVEIVESLREAWHKVSEAQKGNLHMEEAQ